MASKGRTLFAIVGWGLVGLTFLGFLLHALLQVKTGNDWVYRNYKHQWMTYLGALASFGLMGIVGLVGLYYRLKSIIQKRRERLSEKAR